MYNKTIKENFFNPTYAGAIQKADAVYKYVDEKSNDIIKLYLKIDEESQEIIDAKFKAFGSPVIIACSNVACELLIGKHISDAKKISHVTLINVLGELPVDKIPTIKMVEKTIAETIKIYEKNN